MFFSFAEAFVVLRAFFPVVPASSGGTVFLALVPAFPAFPAFTAGLRSVFIILQANGKRKRKIHIGFSVAGGTACGRVRRSSHAAVRREDDAVRMGHPRGGQVEDCHGRKRIQGIRRRGESGKLRDMEI